MKLFAPREDTGWKKQLICARFGHKNSPGSIFCDECGAELIPVFERDIPEKPSLNVVIQGAIRVLGVITLLSIIVLSANFTYHYLTGTGNYLEAIAGVKLHLVSIAGAAVGCLLATIMAVLWRNFLAEERRFTSFSLPLGIQGAVGGLVIFS